MGSIDFKEVSVDKLSATHNLRNFDCGDTDLNEFLKQDALHWQNNKLAVTRLFIYHEQIIGFYCVSSDAIKLKLDEKEKEHRLDQKRITEIPAIKIGRLARDIKYKSNGVGEFILKWAMGHILKLSEDIGIRFITVDSYQKRVKWYEAFGFTRNMNDKYINKENNVSMRLCILNPPQ